MAISRGALDRAQGALRGSIEDVRQWEPSRPEGNPYDTSELNRMYGQSVDQLSMGQAMYNSAMGMLQEVISDFKGRMGLLEVEAAQAQHDIYSGDSLAQAEGKAVLEENLMQQSRMGKNMEEGSSAWQQSQLLSQMGADTTRIAAATGAAGSSESLSRDAASLQALEARNRGMMGALGGQAQGAMAKRGLAGQMARQGLGSMQQGVQSLTGARLQHAGQHMQYSGMAADALRARMQSRGQIVGAEQDAYLTRRKAQADADKAARERTRKWVGAGIAAGTAGIGGAIGMTGGKKGDKKSTKKGKK